MNNPVFRRPKNKCWLGSSVFVVLLLTLHDSGMAQELQPRAYTPAPVGIGFIGASLGSLSGGVLFEPTLPIGDVHVAVKVLTASLGGVFSTLGRTSQGFVILPYVEGNLTGKLFGTEQFQHRSGLADSVFRYSINLFGAPAMGRKEFASYKQKNILGVSFTVQAPTGQYDPGVLVNIGTNRWAFRPEAGVSTTHGRWTYESAFGAWLFSRNSNFFGHSVRTQRPLWSTYAHAVRTVPQRYWFAFDAAYFYGGTIKVNNLTTSSNQSNLRLGATFGLNLSGRQLIRFSYYDTVVARRGADARWFGATYQFLWATGR